MRLAIPIEDDGRVSVHTGRCAAFAIYTIDNGTVIPESTRTHHSPHHDHAPGRGQGQGRGGGFQHGYRHGQDDCHEPGHGHHGGGHPHNHGGMLTTLRDVDMVIALGAGPRLQQDFARAGIEIAFTRERNPEAIAALVAEGGFSPHPKGSLCNGHTH